MQQEVKILSFRKSIRKVPKQLTLPMKYKLLVFLVSSFILIIMISSLRTNRSLHKFVKFNLSQRHASSSLVDSALKTVIINHPSYDKVENFVIGEYGLEGALYHHRKSGAQVR